MIGNIKSIEIGETVGTSVQWDIEHSANAHVALIGASGSGKSVQAQKIICGLVQAGGTVLIIDQHGSFTDDQILPAYRNDIDSQRNDIDACIEGIPCRLRSG